jgi:hypothetical protein
MGVLHLPADVEIDEALFYIQKHNAEVKKCQTR